MSKGWIKLYRKIQTHELYPTGRTFTKLEAWIDILLQVNHNEKKVMIGNALIKCKRGESVRSIKRWARRWKWSRRKVTAFFDLLESEHMIVYKTHTKYTYLKVCEYSTYQDPDTSNAHQTHIKRTSNAHQTHTNKNVKNDKNDKKNTNTTSVENRVSDEAIELAHHLRDRIIDHDPHHKYATNPPSFRRWYIALDRAIRLDKRTPEQLRFLIDYIFTRNTRVANFWKPNIQSGSKLREQFDQLKEKVKQEINHHDQRPEQESRTDRFFRISEQAINQFSEGDS